jgi:hypothetical protein
MQHAWPHSMFEFLLTLRGVPAGVELKVHAPFPCESSILLAPTVPEKRTEE